MYTKYTQKGMSKEIKESKISRKDDVELLSADNESSNPQEFSPLKHALSQYFWILFIASFCFIGINYKPYQESGIINAAQTVTKWSDEADPIWFGHLTDIHVNSLDSTTNPRFFAAISALSELSVDDLLITGDLVDNWGEMIINKYGHQYEPDFQLYNKTVSQYASKFKHIFDMAGNHDVFGLYSFTSKNNHLLDYSKHFTRPKYQKLNDFWASSTETDNFVFVLLNPFRFPAPHARFDYFVRPTTEILDFVQRELDKHKNSKKPVIVACHYPMYFWLNTALSSSKKTFIDMIIESNASIHISGHIHPHKPIFQHHNGFLEVAAADVKEHSCFSICAFDNGRVSFHTFRNKSEAKVVLTHPVPVMHTSNRNAFDERNTAIRVLSFGSRNMNINVRGAVEGKLKFQREVKPNVYLYSLPISLDSGYHTIEFYGDWEYECDFFVGSKIASFREGRYGSTNKFSTGIVYSFLFVIFIFIMLLPIHLTLDTFVNSCVGNFCFYTFCGFLTVRQRIQCLPFWLRNMLFLAFLAPIIVPISLVDDEGHIGVHCLYGYMFDGIIVYDLWGQLICSVYEACVVLTSTFFAAGMAVSQPWHPVFILDIVVCVGGVAYGIYFISGALLEAAGPFLTFCSPLFVGIPIVLVGSILFWRLTAPAEFFRDRRNPQNDTKKKVD